MMEHTVIYIVDLNLKILNKYENINLVLPLIKEFIFPELVAIRVWFYRFLKKGYFHLYSLYEPRIQLIK